MEQEKTIQEYANAYGISLREAEVWNERGWIQTLEGMKKITDYPDFNLYSMHVCYDYDLDAIIDYGITDTETCLHAIIEKGLPGLPLKIRMPDFGCSAFTLKGNHVLMGRNYDFRFNTSAMLVHTSPKDAYRSIAFAALNNLDADHPIDDPKQELAALASPFVCLDGINEKGLSIAVLTLDSKPTIQNTGKKGIGTSLVIRMVLDRCADIKEAVQLLNQYDMKATAGRDYHFYMTDAYGNGAVVEYDCDDPARPLKAVKTRSVTNFFALYKDRVKPNQKNGIYGHGKERYDSIESILSAMKPDDSEKETAWKALRSAWQTPVADDITSNTQWSIVFDNHDLTADIVMHRYWPDILHCTLDEDPVL